MKPFPDSVRVMARVPSRESLSRMTGFRRWKRERIPLLDGGLRPAYFHDFAVRRKGAGGPVRLDGRTAIVTGCNTGIGKHSAFDLCAMGCRVVMACRDVEKAETARKDILRRVEGLRDAGQLVVRKLDLSSLRAVRTFAEGILKEESRIDILVNNAGVMMCPKRTTEDGFEMQFATNHLGHFLLTILLLPRILSSAPARIINVTSEAHRVGDMNFDDLNWERTPYSPAAAYGRSKLANILFTKELAKRLEGKGVNTYAVHPGAVRTDLGRHLDAVYFPGFRRLFRFCLGWCLKSPGHGARTTVYCAADPRAARETGLYYRDCAAADPGPRASDPAAAARLWDVSWQMVGLADDHPVARFL